MSYLKWTGHPFVDCGIAATLAYSKKQSPNEIELSDLEKIKGLLLKVYIEDAWIKSFHNIFTGNCKLLHNSLKSKPAKENEYKKFLEKLLKNSVELGNTGNCIACGQRNAVSRKNRVDVPLMGSGNSRGFFPSASEGADFCELCAYMIQCSPLSYYECGGAKFLLLHSGSKEVQVTWANETINEVNKQVSANNFTGPIDDGFANPQNALFHLTSIVSRKLQNLTKNISITLYHFSNYLQKPELKIYEMPAPVFSFVAAMQHQRFHQYWDRIVKRGFVYRQKVKQELLNDESANEDLFKKKNNKVYTSLLNSKSILPHFLSIKERSVFCDFDLVKLYLNEVLFMEEQRIETIKKIADEIAEFIRQSPKGKKRLRDLETSVKFRDFCNALRKISKERIELNPTHPLITMDEFAKELFPEGSYRFGDTRYLILFRLYERLHDWLKDQGGLAENEDSVREIDDDVDQEDFDERNY